MSPMNKLPGEKRTQILAMLCEGASMRSVSRLADVSINAVARLLTEAGTFCASFHDERVRGVKARRVQCDEIWFFTYAKQKNVATAKRQDMAYGDTWTWTGIDAESKLILSWLVGGRDSEYAAAFMADLRDRLANRVQITTDGHRAYLEAIEEAFGADVDYAMLVKLYGEAPEGQRRYSPAECTGCLRKGMSGNPDPKHVSTSFAERQNLTMRMSMRRFTRLTNGFSKKVEKHEHMIAIYTVWYNWCRLHKSLRVTPAMAAGLTDRVWDLSDIVSLMEADQIPQKRGPYRKRA